ncbi:MAG: hypothetical protein P1S46_01670 [bacterium]|nr:hypothetical protein [bacterium]MDT8366909.1 hypothetical protein [bacterium]
MSKTLQGSDPVTLVSGHIRALRRRHMINRTLAIFSIALIVDLLFNLVAAIAFNVWNVKLGVPFLFETLFLVLMIRERTRGSSEMFATLVDDRFDLKDRLYSYVWFSGGNRVQNRIRQAQALETLEAVDFERLRRSMKVRAPVALLLTLPIFGFLMYMTWNAEYRPPDIATRMIIGRIAPDPHPAVSTTLQADTEGTQKAAPEPGMDPDRLDGPGNKTSLEKERLSALDKAQRETTEKAADSEGISDLGDTSEPGAGPNGSGGSAVGGLTTIPESLESIFESPTASEPIPPNLAANAAYSFRDLPDATRFLSLVPGQGSKSLARLDPGIISNFEEGIESFPDRYREPLQTYYWELKKWSQKP